MHLACALKVTIHTRQAKKHLLSRAKKFHKFKENSLPVDKKVGWIFASLKWSPELRCSWRIRFVLLEYEILRLTIKWDCLRNFSMFQITKIYMLWFSTLTISSHLSPILLRTKWRNSWRESFSAWVQAAEFNSTHATVFSTLLKSEVGAIYILWHALFSQKILDRCTKEIEQNE